MKQSKELTADRRLRETNVWRILTQCIMTRCNCKRMILHSLSGKYRKIFGKEQKVVFCF